MILLPCRRLRTHTLMNSTFCITMNIYIYSRIIYKPHKIFIKHVITKRKHKALVVTDTWSTSPL